MGLTREQLVQLTNRSPDMIVATNRKGRVIYYNDGASRSLGYTPDEVMGTFVGRLYPTVEEARRVAEAGCSMQEIRFVLYGEPAFRVFEMVQDAVKIEAQMLKLQGR